MIRCDTSRPYSCVNYLKIMYHRKAKIIVFHSQDGIKIKHFKESAAYYRRVGSKKTHDCIVTPNEDWRIQKGQHTRMPKKNIEITWPQNNAFQQRLKILEEIASPTCQSFVLHWSTWLCPTEACTSNLLRTWCCNMSANHSH